MFGLDALLNVGGKLIDKLIPDPEAKAKAQLDLAKMAQDGELAKMANETKMYEVEQNNLTVKGKQTEDDEKIYLHRGIASRQFQRAFVLADGIEILGATLDNGLLHIDMKRIPPESNARKIQISSGSKAMAISQQPQKAIEVENQ